MFRDEIEALLRDYRALLLRAWERSLEPFRQALDAWLVDLFGRAVPEGWREEFAAFLQAQEAQGFAVETESARGLADWIEAWGKRSCDAGQNLRRLCGPRRQNFYRWRRRCPCATAIDGRTGVVRAGHANGAAMS